MLSRNVYLASAAVAMALMYATATAEEMTMPVEGAELPYISEGSGTPVLFVHGAISDLRAWDAYRPIIADDRRYVAYSQRYYGTSAWPDDGENFQRTTHVENLIAFVEGLDAGPVHLVTWSYSGEIGVHTMLQRPDLFRSAIHYEPAIGPLVDGVPGGENASRKLFAHFGPVISAVREDRAEDAALRFIEAVFQMPEGTAVGEAGEEMWRDNGRTVAPWLAMDPLPVDCGTLSRLTVPTLVVQGADAFTRSSMQAERVASCVANGMVVTMPDVNHDGPYRAGEEFAALIESFLSLVE